MRKKYNIAIIFIALIAIVGLVELSYGWTNLLFDQIPYNYTSTVTIPSNSGSGSLSGYYIIKGKGRNFNIYLSLPGAEQGESPLDYTKDGMNGSGHIDNIQIGMNTIKNLFSGDFKSALFSTPFNGTLNVSCAAWTGKVIFHNNGTDFPANFTIDGQMTDWEGGFIVFQKDNRIVIKADYIYFPSGQKGLSTPTHVQKDYFF
jgi:hypothetical protein